MEWVKHKPKSAESIAYNSALAEWAEEHPKRSNGWYDWELMRALSGAPNTNTIRMAVRRGQVTKFRRDKISSATPTTTNTPSPTGSPELYQFDIGKPLSFGRIDAVICGDVQLPTTSLEWCTRVSQVGEALGIKRLIIAGDLFNLDAFSQYAPIYSQPSWAAEKAAARDLIAMWLLSFDHIYLFAGNHEHRLSKATGGAMGIHDLADMLRAPDDRLTVSHHGHCTIDSHRGVWRVTHGRNYSINQLTVAAYMADNEGQHIIHHHQHHCARGWSRSGRYEAIDNGGLFDQSMMGYATIEDSKSPKMQQGFCVLRGGYVTQYSNATNWETVLS